MASSGPPSKYQDADDAQDVAGRSSKVLHKAPSDVRSEPSQTAPTSITKQHSDLDTITVRPKPDFKLPPLGSGGLQARLRSFIPQMAASNQALSNTNSMEEVDESKEHIVMDLGLGVLEERSTDSSDSSSDEDSENEEDVLGALKGKGNNQKPSIQEVG